MPYSVPEGYFEDLSTKMCERIRTEEQSPKEQPKRRSSIPVQIFRYSFAAAAIALVVALGITLSSLKNETVNPEDGLQDSDYIFYYSEIVPFTEPESIYYSYDSTSETLLNEEDIINYLYESGIDVDNFLDE